jgi:hypothetical protein
MEGDRRTAPVGKSELLVRAVLPDFAEPELRQERSYLAGLQNWDGPHSHAT